MTDCRRNYHPLTPSQRARIDRLPVRIISPFPLHFVPVHDPRKNDDDVSGSPLSADRLAKVFVEVADTLVADFDVVDFLHTLANRTAELFEAAEAGVMLGDQRGGLRVVASSSERAR